MDMNGEAATTGLLDLLARRLAPGIAIVAEASAAQGLGTRFPDARIVDLADAMDDAGLPPIDLLLLLGAGEPLTPPLLRLLGQVRPGGVIVTAMPVDLRRGLAAPALRRFGPTRPGRLFRLGDIAITLPPGGVDPVLEAIADALPGMGAEALHDAAARYDIIVEGFADRVMQGSDTMLHGAIYNRDAGALDFDQVRHDPLRVAARLWRHGRPTTIAEPRAVPEPQLLPAGGRARFSLRLPTADLPPGEYPVVIDLVREGTHWFQDRGHPVMSLVLTVSAMPEVASPEWGESVSPAALQEMAILGQVLRQADLLGEPLFEDIRRHALLPRAAPTAADEPDPALLLVMNELAEVTPGCPVPITRMMLHLRASLRLQARWHLRTAENRFEFLCWYVREAPSHIAGGRVPVPALLSDFLNADALPAWARPMRLSQLMLNHWRDGHLAPRLLDPAMAEGLMFEWVHAVIPWHRMDPAVMPAHAIEALQAPAPGQAAPGIVSVFTHRLHGESAGSRERHDLTTATGQLALVFALLVAQGADPLRRRLLGQAALCHFAGCIDADPQSLTRMEFLVAACCGVLGGLPGETAPAWRSVRIQRWFESVVCRVRPDFAAFSSLRQQGVASAAVQRAPRCTVIGMVDSPTGLGVNLRMTAGALRRIGIQPVLRDLGIDLPEAPSSPLPHGTAETMMQRDVVIIHMNADQVPQILAQPNGAGRPGSYRIGFFLWELEVLPESHRLALDLVDEIWVPSAYLARLYSAAFDKPVINMRKGITLPPVTQGMPRARFGIDEAAFCFLCSFDFHSSVERKNPMAVVRAFQAAFPPGDDAVRLVIKSTDVVPGHWGDPHGQWLAIEEAARADRRIHVIVEALDFPDYLGLIAACDCVVSAHRAEGFGYLPAYGMLLGKPAIVTDYSGTQEYCDETTAFPVRATARPMVPAEAIFPVDGAHWAEIDEAHLAARMGEVMRDPAAAAARTAAGQALLRQEFSEAALAARYAERLRALGAVGAAW